MTRIALCFMLLCLTLITSLSSLADSTHQSRSANSLEETVKTKTSEAYGNLPLLFIKNQGQVEDRVQYYIKASGQTIYFIKNGIVFDLVCYYNSDKENTTSRNAERLVFSLDFNGTNDSLSVIGKDKAASVVNYFIGNDPEKWHTDVLTYRKITY